MTGTLPEYFSLAIMILAYGWLIVSALIFIYWFFDPEMGERFAGQHEKIAVVVYIGSFFCLIVVLGQGIEDFLSFIPADWGDYNEDREFVKDRSKIANGLAFLISLFFVQVFSKLGMLRVENRHLSVNAEIYRRMDGFRCSTREALIKKREETDNELAQLCSSSYEGNLSSEEEKEFLVLEGLLEEIDYRLGKTDHRDAIN